MRTTVQTAHEMGWSSSICRGKNFVFVSVIAVGIFAIIELLISLANLGSFNHAPIPSLSLEAASSSSSSSSSSLSSSVSSRRRPSRTNLRPRSSFTTKVSTHVISSSAFDEASKSVFRTLQKQSEAIRQQGNKAATSSISQSSRTITLTSGETQVLPPSTLVVRRQDFDVAKWPHKSDGGLEDADRTLLAQIYSQAGSVFEYGLGESTRIANHLGVSRYAGIDSSIAWIQQTQEKVSPHFRFYYGDVGAIEGWGYPADPFLHKSVWQYQVAPLQAEPEAFDVYFVDGRWRVACMLLSFLHASARGAPDTMVLVHDCFQKGYSPVGLDVNVMGVRYYTVNDDLFDLVDHSHMRLCVYKRKSSTTDSMLLERYEKYRNDPQ